MKTLFHHNIETLKQKRQSLRNNSTDAEVLLWERLKGSQLGVKFRRQHSVDYYIFDFYCPKWRLAIEVDGSSHFSKAEYDKYRTKYLEAFNIKVIRFWNSEVINNLDWVVNQIENYVPT